MASSVPQEMDTDEFREKMAAFPCMFNMPCFDHPQRNRLKDRKVVLERELEEGFDTKEDERKAKNALTWVYYQLGLFDRAEAMNESVLVDTGYKDIVSLGNFVFMEWMRNGRISEHFKLLDKLRENSSFDDMAADSKAEQAYFLGKLGNPYNQMSSVRIYEEILALNEKDKWRYSLGLAYRRLAVMRGLEKCSGNKLSQKRCHELAESCYKKLTTSTDMSLRALGLVNLAANYSKSNVLMVESLKYAVTIDPHTSEVFLAAGRPTISIDAAQAVAWLEKAVELGPGRSVCHHQLGRAYLSLARGFGRGNYHKRATEEKAQRHFLQAYELSGKLNLAPLMDLARLYQRQNKTSLSERQAMTLFKSRYASYDALPSLIQAHMHLFYLAKDEKTYCHMLLSILASCDLMKIECKAEERHKVWATMFESDQRRDEKKLKNSAKDLCYTLRKNDDNIRQSLKSISRFVRDGRIDDIDAIASEARNIQRSGQNEEALLFLELVSLRPGTDTQRIRDLHRQLLDRQAQRCLCDSLSIASIFFRQSFDMFSRSEELQDNEMEADSDLSIKVDMAVLFNDSVTNPTTLCAETAYGLEDAVSTLFGLKVAFNPMVDVAQGGSQGKAMADFVHRHQVDVIVVVFEGDGTETQYLTEKIGPFIGDSHHDDGGHRPSVVLVQCYERPALYLPHALKRLPCLSLGQTGDPFPNLFCEKEVQEQADKCIDIKGVLDAYFQGNTDNVITLFKHLVCCEEVQAQE